MVLYFPLFKVFWNRAFGVGRTGTNSANGDSTLLSSFSPHPINVSVCSCYYTYIRFRGCCCCWITRKGNRSFGEGLARSLWKGWCTVYFLTFSMKGIIRSLQNCETMGLGAPWANVTQNYGESYSLCLCTGASVTLITQRWKVPRICHGHCCSHHGRWQKQHLASWSSDMDTLEPKADKGGVGIMWWLYLIAWLVGTSKAIPRNFHK